MATEECDRQAGRFLAETEQRLLPGVTHRAARAWRYALSRDGDRSKVDPLKSTFTTRQILFDAQPPRIRPRGFWPLVLALTGLSLWSGSVACLWTNESSLLFMARRSRIPPPVPGSGVFQLTTSDGVPLDALSLTSERPSAYWILFCPPSGRSIH